MDKSNKESMVDQNKRDFVKKAAYTTPAIVTMAAIPSFASAGSAWQRENRNPDRNRPNNGNRPVGNGSGRR